MSRLFAGLALFAVALILGPTASAQDGDSATLRVTDARLGEPVTLTIEVLTDAGSTVELDPASPAWGDIEVIGIDSQEQFPEGERVRHVLEVRVAPFNVGAVAFAPAVNVVTGSESQPRELPALSIDVLPTLPADAPLELSPLPLPSGIAGGESPFLKPLIGLGAVAGLLLLVALTWLTVRAILRRPRRLALPDPYRAPPDLAGADAILDSDPVGAYRTLAAAVRRHLSDRYGFPAVALTARELERRMEAEGVDRWEARLVGGLLENCDAVVYAGYRPAFERRQADLTMAREIVEAGA
ncbi:MAG: hypothetical protein WD557_10975 [Dehalococcoidia bacterium]